MEFGFMFGLGFVAAVGAVVLLLMFSPILMGTVFGAASRIPSYLAWYLCVVGGTMVVAYTNGADDAEDLLIAGFCASLVYALVWGMFGWSKMMAEQKRKHREITEKRWRK